MEQAQTNNWQQIVFILVLIGIGIVIAVIAIAISSDNFYAESVLAETSSATETSQVQALTQENPTYFKVTDIPSTTQPADSKMLLFFSETWDSFSTRMESLLAEVGSTLPIVKIDISENRAVATNYAVDDPATLLLIGEDGLEIARVSEPSRPLIDEMLMTSEAGTTADF